MPNDVEEIAKDGCAALGCLTVLIVFGVALIVISAVISAVIKWSFGVLFS